MTGCPLWIIADIWRERFLAIHSGLACQTVSRKKLKSGFMEVHPSGQSGNVFEKRLDLVACCCHGKLNSEILPMCGILHLDVR